MKVVISLATGLDKFANQIFDVNARTYLEFIQNQKDTTVSLKVLEFFGEADAKILLIILQSFTRLCSINLSSIPKTLLLEDSMLQAIARLEQLNILRLENLKLEKNDIATLQTLLIASKIKNLSFANNNLGDEGLSALLSIIFEMPFIAEIDLGYNNISPIGCTEILALLKIKKINRIGLSGNHISEEQILEFSAHYLKNLAAQKDQSLPVTKAAAIDNSSSNKSMVLENPNYDPELHANVKDLIAGDPDSNDAEYEFWKEFKTDIRQHYSALSSKELFGEDLDKNIIMDSFSPVFSVKSFQELKDKVQDIVRNKKINLPILKFENLDFTKIKLDIFMAKLKFIIVDLSKSIALERNAIFEHFDQLLTQIQLFFTSGIGFYLQNHNANLYQQLKNQAICINIQDFKQVLFLLKNCCAAYSGLGLDWHYDLDINSFSANLSYSIEVIDNNADSKYTPCFDLILDQYNKDSSCFAASNQDSKYCFEGVNTLKIEGVLIRASEVAKLMHNNFNSVQNALVICTGSFILDTDFVLPSKNLSIFSPNCIITGDRSINLSPEPENLSKADSGRDECIDNGPNKANSGENGQPGKSGKASGNFILITNRANELSGKFKLTVNGNPGGAGGDAGKAANGISGKDGYMPEDPPLPRNVHIEQDYIHYLKGGDGTRGTIGGDSGCPGPGGLGGASGSVELIDLAANTIKQHHGIEGKSGETGATADAGTGGKNGLNRPDFVKRKIMKRKFGLNGKFFGKIAKYSKDEERKRGRFHIQSDHEYDHYYRGYKANYKWPHQYKNEHDPEFTQVTFAANGKINDSMVVQQNRQNINAQSMQDMLENIKIVSTSKVLSRSHKAVLTESFNKLTALIGNPDKIPVKTNTHNYINLAKIEKTAEAIYHKSYQANVNQEDDRIAQENTEENALQVEYQHVDMQGIDIYSIQQNNYFQKCFMSLDDVNLPISFMNNFAEELSLAVLKIAAKNYNECKTNKNLDFVLLESFNLLQKQFLLNYYLAQDDMQFFIEISEMLYCVYLCYSKMQANPPIFENSGIFDKSKAILIYPYPYVESTLNALYASQNYKLVDVLKLSKDKFKAIYHTCFLFKKFASPSLCTELIADERFVDLIRKSVVNKEEYANYNLLRFAYKVYLTVWLNLGYFHSQHESMKIYNACMLLKNARIDAESIVNMSIFIASHINFFTHNKHLQPLTDVYKPQTIEAEGDKELLPEPPQVVSDEWLGLYDLTDNYLLNFSSVHPFVLNSWNNQENLGVKFYGNKAKFQHYSDEIKRFDSFLETYHNESELGDANKASEALEELIENSLSFAKLGNFDFVEKVLSQRLNNHNKIAFYNLAYTCKLMGYSSEQSSKILQAKAIHSDVAFIEANLQQLETYYTTLDDPKTELYIRQNINIILFVGLRSTLFNKEAIALNLLKGQVAPHNLAGIFISKQFSDLTEAHQNVLKNYLTREIITVTHKGFNLYRLFASQVAIGARVKEFIGLNIVDMYLEERFGEFLRSKLFTKIFDENKYDFAKFALHKFCKHHAPALLELASFIQNNNLCHTFDLNQLQILYCLHPLVKHDRYHTSINLAELQGMFVAFKNQPINTVVAFITDLNACNSDIVNQLATDIFIPQLNAENSLTVLELMPFVDYLSILNNNKSQKSYPISELPTINDSIEYVHGRLEVIPESAKLCVQCFGEGFKLINALKSKAQQLGEDPIIFRYMITLHEHASNDFQEQLVSQQNVSEITEKTLTSIFEEIKLNFNLRKFADIVFEEKNLDHIGIFEQFVAQLDLIQSLISKNYDCALLKSLYILSKITRDKLGEKLSSLNLATLTETLPLVLNSRSSLDCLAKLMHFDLMEWPSVALSLNILDIIELLCGTTKEQDSEVLDLLLEDDFTTYGKKALLFGLNAYFKKNKKISFSEIIKLLKSMSMAKITLLDSVHLFKEENLHAWLERTQLFSVCKLIRNINVNSLDDYAQINGVFYKLITHEKRNYASMVEIIDCLMEMSNQPNNRSHLPKIAEAIYFSNIPAQNIISYVKSDITTAVEKIKYGNASTTVEPALTTEQLCATFNATNDKQDLETYLPAHLAQVIDSIHEKAKSIYAEIQNLDDSAINIETMPQFSIIASVNAATAEERELQFKQNMVEIFACLLALYAKANNKMAYNTQILSVLVSMYTSNISKMQRIKTGEGKTLIVALTAAALAIKKFKVDIVTSNRGLAEEGQAESQKFFDLLKLSCDRCCHVNDNNKNNEAFTNNIVYGTISSFQSKILDHRFNEISPAYTERYDGPFALLVDEADCVMVDKAGHMLYNASNHPHFKLIENILILVFSTTLGELGKIRNAKDKNAIFKAIGESVNRQIIDGKIQVPAESQDFCVKNTLYWAESAYSAMHMTNMDSFIISQPSKEKKTEPEVLIIDKQTGYEEYSTKWMNALTQYIEMINGLIKSEITLKSNYVSNYWFFKFYGKNIYGVTGTVGDAYTIEKYRELYGIETFVLPPYRNSKLRVLTCGVVKDLTPDYEIWSNAICKEVTEIAKNQPIEIVCENVFYANKIAKILKNQGFDTHEYFLEEHKNHIKNLNDNKDANNVVGVQRGQIIITTNRGGRGTDIHVNHSCDLHGRGSPQGLHVLITFMPINVREAEQILGRTARNGNPGTASYIVNLPEAKLSNGPLMNFLDAETVRDDNDIRRLDNDIYIKTPALALEEELNLLYVKCYKDIEIFLKDIKFKELSLSSGQINIILNNFTTHWSLWLSQNQETIRDVTKDIEKENRNQVIKERSAVIINLFKDKFDKFLKELNSCQNLFKEDSALNLLSFNWLEMSKYISQMEILPKPAEFTYDQDSGPLEAQYLKHSDKVEKHEKNQNVLRAEFKKLCILNAIALNEPTGAAHLMAATLYNKNNLKAIIYHLKEARFLLQRQHGNISSSKEGFNIVKKYMKLRTGSNSKRDEQLTDHEKILMAHLSIIDSLAGKKLCVNDIKNLILEQVDDNNKGPNEEDKKLKNDLIDYLKSERLIKSHQIRKKWQNIPAKNSASRGYTEKFSLSKDLKDRLAGVASYINVDELVTYVFNKPSNNRDFIFDDVEKHVKSYEGFLELLFKESIISANSKQEVVAIDLSAVRPDIFLPHGIDYYETLTKVIEKFSSLEIFEKSHHLFIFKTELASLKDIDAMEFYETLRKNNFVKDVDCWSFNADIDLAAKNYDTYSDTKFYGPENANELLSVAQFLQYLNKTYNGKLYASFILLPTKNDAQNLIQNYLHMQDVLKDMFLKDPASIEIVPRKKTDRKAHIHSDFHMKVKAVDLTRFRVTNDELASLHKRTLAQLKDIDEEFSLGFVDFMQSNLVRDLNIDHQNLDYFITLMLDRFLTLNIRKDDSGWRFAAAMLALVGFLEIIVGCILIYTGIAAPLGVFLINEGISDLLYAYQVLQTERFDLREYCAHKAISMFVNAISVGVACGGSTAVPTLGKFLIGTAVHVAVSKTLDYIYIEAVNKNFHKLVKDLKTAIVSAILKDHKHFLVKICAYYDGSENPMGHIYDAFNALDASNTISNDLAEELNSDVDKVVNAAASALKSIAQKITTNTTEAKIYKYCILAAKGMYDLVKLNVMIQSGLRSVRKLENIAKFKIKNLDAHTSTPEMQAKCHQIYHNEFESTGGVYQLKQQYSRIESSLTKCVDAWVDKALLLTLEPALAELKAIICDIVTAYSYSLLPNERDDRLLDEIQKANDKHTALNNEEELPSAQTDDKEALENAKAIKKAKKPVELDHLPKKSTEETAPKVIEGNKTNKKPTAEQNKKSSPAKSKPPSDIWKGGLVDEPYLIYESEEGMQIKSNLTILTAKEERTKVSTRFVEKKQDKDSYEKDKKIAIGKKIVLNGFTPFDVAISDENGKQYARLQHSFHGAEIGAEASVILLANGGKRVQVEATAKYYLHRTQVEGTAFEIDNLYGYTMGVKCKVDAYVGLVGVGASYMYEISPAGVKYGGGLVPLNITALPSPGFYCEVYANKSDSSAQTTTTNGLLKYFAVNFTNLIEQLFVDTNRSLMKEYDKHPEAYKNNSYNMDNELMHYMIFSQAIQRKLDNSSFGGVNPNPAVQHFLDAYNDAKMRKFKIQ